VQLAPGSLLRDSRSDAPVEVRSRQQEWTCPDLYRFYRAVPPDCEFEYSAPVVKEIEVRLDGLLIPSSDDLSLPLVFLEAQMQRVSATIGFSRSYTSK
jgi:hypothetical protein